MMATNMHTRAMQGQQMKANSSNSGIASRCFELRRPGVVSKAKQGNRHQVASRLKALLENRTVKERDEAILFDNWEKAIKSSMKEENHYKISATEIVGEIPKELEGTLYKVGPALFERDGVEVGHIFDGDGAVSKLKIENGEVIYTTKFVQTEGYKRDEEAGKFVCRGAYATPRPAPEVLGMKLPEALSNAFDLNFKNTSNITTIPWGGKLLIGWNELPYVVDLDTLDTVGQDTLQGAFDADDKVQAHFAVDEEKNRIVMFALNTSNPVEYYIKFYEFDEHFKLISKRVEKLPIQGGVPILHDITLTDDYIMLFQAPLSISQEDMMSLLMGMKNLNEVIEYQKDKECALMIAPRDSSKPWRVLDAPNSWTWHIVSSEQDENADGSVRLGIHAFSSPDYHFKYDFTGVYGKDYVLSRLNKYTAHLGGAKDGQVEQKLLSRRNMEMPDCARNRKDIRWGYSLTVNKEEGFAPLQCLAKIDLKKGEGMESATSGGDILEDMWCPPSNAEFLSEPTFVARSEADSHQIEKEEDDGWVLSLCHNVDTFKASLLIFDAKTIGNGPIATVPLKSWIPWVFHGAWVKKA